VHICVTRIRTVRSWMSSHTLLRGIRLTYYTCGTASGSLLANVCVSEPNGCCRGTIIMKRAHAGLGCAGYSCPCVVSSNTVQWQAGSAPFMCQGAKGFHLCVRFSLNRQVSV
jgi:hypothetical protein